MIQSLELLRFNWKPSVIRLALAALVDGGPVPRRAWVMRAGLPANHFAAALAEARRLGLLAVETPAEGLRLLVQPVEFWKERPLAGAEDFARAWARFDGRGVAEQRRLPLATEMPGLAEALAETGSAAVPDSGGEGYRIPGAPFNVQRLTSSERSREAFNVERSEGTGFRAGWIEPATEAEAMAACQRLLAVGHPREMAQWGGRWRNRWRSHPDGLRKVLNMVREDQATGRTPQPGSTWGRYASDLWDRFVEAKA